MRMFFIPVAIVAMIIIFRAIKKGQISMNDSFFWMSASIMILVLGFFPKSIDYVANLLKIYYPPSLLFLMAIIFLLYICFRLLKQIHTLNLRVIELAQQMAIMRSNEEGKVNKKKSL